MTDRWSLTKKEIKKPLINKSNFLWTGTVTLVRNCAEFSLGNLQAAALVYKICLKWHSCKVVELGSKPREADSESLVSTAPI